MPGKVDQSKQYVAQLVLDVAFVSRSSGHVQLI
jgi:hypothetical protein